MAKCVCGAEIGCPCNLKTASDGSKRCGACLYNYEESLHPKNLNSTEPDKIIENKIYEVAAPIINSISHSYTNF